MASMAPKDAERRGAAGESRTDNPQHEDTEQMDPEATAVLMDNPTESQPQAQLERLLGEAEAKAEENWNNYLRSVAELENVRRRAQRDVENAHKFGLEKFAQELLGVKDSLEMGVEAGANADARSLLAGKEATLKLLSKAFEKFNITEINPAGAPFDPQQHEAIAMQESATAEPGSVLQVIQKGYDLNGRLLRPARVIVAKAPGQ
jgi:molecular chaperone GrpE